MIFRCLLAQHAEQLSTNFKKLDEKHEELDMQATTDFCFNHFPVFCLFEFRIGFKEFLNKKESVEMIQNRGNEHIAVCLGLGLQLVCSCSQVLTTCLEVYAL
jgi:hypothetical protein